MQGYFSNETFISRCRSVLNKHSSFKYNIQTLEPRIQGENYFHGLEHDQRAAVTTANPAMSLTLLKQLMRQTPAGSRHSSLTVMFPSTTR
jgi:hypothetical protein